MRIAVLGGTGAEGGGLAFRWAAAGHEVVIGSRDATRAQAGAEELNALLNNGKIEGADNHMAASGAEVIVLAVPYAAQQSTALGVAAALEGKILIDVTCPLVPPKVSLVQLPEGGSAVATLQAKLGAGVRVVSSAFQNISAHHLKKLDHVIDCDVLVCADDTEAADVAIGLAHRRGPARTLCRRAGELGGGRGADVDPDRDQPALQGAVFRDSAHRLAHRQRMILR